MGKKTSESSKYREWERERRERLNVSFNDLGSLLPNHDPAIVTSKVDILQKSAAYIRDLKKENSELLLSKASKLQAKKIKRLQRYVEALLLRVQQLAKLLRDAGITLPPEPPTLSPLGEKIPRWSNKISPKDAERALEAEKNSKNATKKKAKVSKKEMNSSSKKDSSPNKLPAKSDNPTTASKSPSAAEAPLSRNKLRSSPPKVDKDSPVMPLQSVDRRPQESGPPIPVGQLFSDPSRILTSLPPQVVGSDQQPGIIVIRTTGASTLGAVTQRPPQSTCFVIDSGNCSSVNNSQPSAIVASHPPTLESRPTFVLASNGSLLPVLPAPQFVAQPRQLLMSTSPVSATNQSLTPITFASSASNSQCIKPFTHPLREVKCSQPINGDISQMKKVPIPALPRNKQKQHCSVKEGTEGTGKAAGKKKCIVVSGEPTKVSKGANLKNGEKKNSKSPANSPSQEKVATTALSQKDIEKVSPQKGSSLGKCENTVPVTSKSLCGDSASIGKKRELPEVQDEKRVLAKKRKLENLVKCDENIPSNMGDKTTNGASSNVIISDGTSICNTEPVNSSAYPLNGSVSSYSIDALCKMNEKISVGHGCSVKDISSRKEKISPSGLSSQKTTEEQAIKDNCHPRSDNPAPSSALEHTLKSVSNNDSTEIHHDGRKKLPGDGEQHMEPSCKVDQENYLSVYSSSQLSSQHGMEANHVDSQNTTPPCRLDAISQNENVSSTENVKANIQSGSEQKGKDDSQSSILPTFGSSQSFVNTEDSFRKEVVGRENNCGNNPMDESSLPPGAFSSDLFASLQVPSGHSESISPTAAFLLAFPLVSTLTGKTPDLGSDNHHSQPLSSLENGSGDNDLSSGGCGSSFLQLGNLEENSPSSSSQSMLSSLTSSNPSSQSTILHLKSANAVSPLVPRSEEHNYEHGVIENDIHLVERQVTPSKNTSKVPPYVPPILSSEPARERCVTERNKNKESDSSAAKIDSLPLKSHFSKENSNECIATLSGNIPSQERINISSMIPSQTHKNVCEDSQVASVPAQSNEQPVRTTPDKPISEPCQSQPFEVHHRTDNNKKAESDNRMFSSSDQQYVSYQLPHVSCGTSDVQETLSTSVSVTHNHEDSSSNRNLRQEMQTLDHSVPTPNIHQNNATFQHLGHSYKSGAKTMNVSKEIPSRENNFSNDYTPQNPSGSILPPVSSSSCFSISSFTTSFPSTISNSLLSSCIVTNSSPSFTSANSGPLLMTSSSYSTSSVTYPSHSNALYSNSSSCATPMYSSSIAPALSASPASFHNSSFSTMPVSVTCTPPVSRMSGPLKTSVSSSVPLSVAHQEAFSNHPSNAASNLLPSSTFSDSASTNMYSSSQKDNRHPVSSAPQPSNLPLKNSSVETKDHTHGNPSNMHTHMSESNKSQNIFSVDQLNNQNYSYNFNDYSSHMPSYMPQKQELEMMAKKSSAVLPETNGGNSTSRMPGSFSVAHNSSNFSILSWTTLSPMSAAPSSSIDPQMNNMNGKVDSYSTSPTSLGMSSGENGAPVAGKVSDASVSSFPQSVMPESRDSTNLYPQYPVGNNNVSAEVNGLTSFPMPQDVGKQTSSRGQGPKPRQQVTNWMTAPDPIHSSDFSPNNDVVGGDLVRDSFTSGTASYNSNSGFYSHHNQSEMPYVSLSNSSVNSNAILNRRSVVPSVATGANDNSHKSCPNISEPSRPLGESILHLQSKPSDLQQNQLASCTYNKMTNSSASYLHGSQSELPALPTLVGDLALGSCNSVKGFLPMYDEASPSTSKVGKQDVKIQASHSATGGCGNAISAKENREGRNTSSSHEYGGSSFLSVSQLVDQVKDSSHQNQSRENDRAGGEKARNRDANKTTPTSRRNVRQSNIKRDSAITSKEQQDSSQMYHSRIPPHGSQTFTNQGISPSIVSSNPTHLHAPPIPFPPYNSVHWPVNEMTKMTDNSRGTANYKSSSSYSAEALIRPSLSAVALDSRVPDVEMSTYGMDIHKYPIPGGRTDLFADFVDSNVIGSNIENVSLPQNHPKQNTQDHRETNDSFRTGHHSSCDKFNYSANTAPATFHSHHHHSHVPASFGNSDDYSVEGGNHTSSLSLSSNCMDFAPFSHSKESVPITSVMSNVCASIGYNSPSNASAGNNQNQNSLCRPQDGKVSMRASNGNCEKTCSGSSSTMQVGSSKPDCSAEGGAKQLTKGDGISHNPRSVPPFLSMEPSTSPYINHHYPHHSHRHHNPSTPYSSSHSIESSSIASLNGSEHQASKLFSRFPAPGSGLNHLSHQSSSVGSGVGSSSHLSSGTLTNFNLSTIFPEINDKQTHHNHLTPSTSSFETSTKSSKLCTVTSAAPILHPPSPLSSSYHHYRPHQHNHQPFPSSVDRLPPSHPPSAVLHSNVGFNNLMVQSTPQVNGIGINSTLQPPPPPPPPFSTPSFTNVLPGL